MTLVGKIITCDKCDFSVDTSVVYSGFFYELPYGYITIPKVLGWCHSCESFKPVEEGDLEKIAEFFKYKLEIFEERVLDKALIFIVNMAKITNHFDELLEKTGLATNESKHLEFKDLFYEKIDPTSFAENFCSLFRNIPEDGFLEIIEKIFKELSDKNLQFGIPKDGLPYFFYFIKRVIKKYPFDFRLYFRLIIENHTEIGLKVDDLVPINHVLWLLSNLTGNSKLANYIKGVRKPRCLHCGSYKVTGEVKMPEDLDNYSSRTRTKKPIGMKHPVCGGNLFAHTSRSIISYYFSKNIYSLDGEKIRTDGSYHALDYNLNYFS